MRTIRLTIEYDGTAYSGWQRQPNGLAVQEVIEGALHQILGHTTDLRSSGRTDAGVHAAAQVASITLTAAITPERLVRACNATLPVDVRIVAAEEMPERFHARIHARGKTYRYFIWHAPSGQPLMRRVAWHVPQRLSLAAMQEAAALFVGEHDFSAGAGSSCRRPCAASGHPPSSRRGSAPVRRI
jgi:tRNA pseudouridine38-40 synthase